MLHPIYSLDGKAATPPAHDDAEQATFSSADECVAQLRLIAATIALIDVSEPNAFASPLLRDFDGGEEHGHLGDGPATPQHAKRTSRQDPGQAFNFCQITRAMKPGAFSSASMFNGHLARCYQNNILATIRSTLTG